MQTPGTFPLRFRLRDAAHRVAAIKAVRDAVGYDFGLKEAKDGIEAGVLYLSPSKMAPAISALAPYADIETTTALMTFPDAVTRLRGVCERLAARAIQRAAEALEKFEQRLGR